MGQVFAQPKPLKDVVRENQRIIKKAIRELDKEVTSLERQEKKTLADIRKAAAQNQLGAARVMAKDVVRTRQYIRRFIEMKSQLSACSLKLQTVKSQDAMVSAMKGVTKAMKAINKQTTLPEIQKVMAEFMKENERAEISQEIIGDAMDDAMEEDGSAAEEESLIQQVLDEVGIKQSEGAPIVPGGALNAGGEAGHSDEVKDDALLELQERMNNLKRT